jgi:hypothetical protein
LGVPVNLPDKPPDVRIVRRMMSPERPGSAGVRDGLRRRLRITSQQEYNERLAGQAIRPGGRLRWLRSSGTGWPFRAIGAGNVSCSRCGLPVSECRCLPARDSS